MSDPGFGPLLREDLEVVLRDLFARNFPGYQHVMHETWEQRLEREVWRRSLRGRWFYAKADIRERVWSVRRTIAERLYPDAFWDEDD